MRGRHACLSWSYYLLSVESGVRLASGWDLIWDSGWSSSQLHACSLLFRPGSSGCQLQALLPLQRYNFRRRRFFQTLQCHRPTHLNLLETKTLHVIRRICDGFHTERQRQIGAWLMSAMHRKAGAFGYPIFVVKKKCPLGCELWLIWSLKWLQFLPDLSDSVSWGFCSFLSVYNLQTTNDSWNR